MMAPAHMASGTCAWLGVGALAAQIGRPMVGTAVVGGAVLATYAALVPDWDHPKSTISRWLGWPTRIASWVIRLLSGGHREGTHSLLAVAVVGTATWGLACKWLGGPLWIPAAVALGYLAGVLGDCLTPHGCPLLWPVSKRTVSADLFPTDSRRERWLVVPVLVIAAVGFGCSAAGMESPAFLDLTGI